MPPGGSRPGPPPRGSAYFSRSCRSSCSPWPRSSSRSTASRRGSWPPRASTPCSPSALAANIGRSTGSAAPAAAAGAPSGCSPTREPVTARTASGKVLDGRGCAAGARTVVRGGEAALEAGSTTSPATVPGGCAVAVVGRSGAWQSTLASLAGRLIDPDEGEITLDGGPAPAHQGRHCAMPSCTPSNARSVRPDAVGGDWLRCLRAVAGTSAVRGDHSRAAPFLARLPGGMQTPLDETPMSGGEVQRLRAGPRVRPCRPRPAADPG